LLIRWLASRHDQANDQAAAVEIVTTPAPIPIDRKELTAKELAALWGVSTRSIYEWKTTGGLPFKKRGRLLRFNWIEADQWGKQHRESFNKARARLRVA
jgi:excisionase family DNA binding protein